MIYNIILQVFFLVLRIYQTIMAIHILSTWIPGLYNYKIFQFIGKISKWYLEPFGGIIVFAGIDFSPIIAFAIFEYILSLII